MARGIESILTDRRVLDWGTKIMVLDPEAAPFLVLSKTLGKEEAKNQVYIDFEDKPFERWGFVHTIGTQDGQTIDTTFNLSAAGGGADMGKYINIGDLLLDWTQKSFVLVTKVNRGVSPVTFAVIKNYQGKGTAGLTGVGAAWMSGKTFDTSDTTETTVSDLVADDVILKVSNVYEDGGLSADARALDLVKHFNFCQKFQDSYEVDRECMKSTLNGGPELKRLQARKAIEHLKNIEYQLILGQKDARKSEGFVTGRTGSADKYIYTTGGLYFEDFWYDSVATLTETAFRSFGRKGSRHGPKEKLFVAGGLIVEGIDVWSMGRLQTKEDTNKTGLHIKQYLMAGLTIDILPHPLLEDYLEGIGFLLDMNVLKYKVFDDTKLHTGIQANDAQIRKDEYITQVGLKVGLIDHHRMIKDVAAIAG